MRLGQPGRITLNFTREADAAQQEIVSALEDVKRAIPDAELIEAGPGYAIERHCIEIARVAMKINVAKESHRLDAPVEDRIRALVA